MRDRVALRVAYAVALTGSVVLGSGWSVIDDQLIQQPGDLRPPVLDNTVAFEKLLLMMFTVSTSLCFVCRSEPARVVTA